MSSTTSANPPSKPSRSGSGRPPTLTELAARISERTPTSAHTGPSPSSSRPRLPAALLARTNSSQGQPASATSSTTSPDSAGVGGANTLDSTTEQLAATSLEDDKRSDESPMHEKDKAPRGYKNVPSLNDITERLGITRTRSSEGAPKAAGEKDASPKAPDATELEDGEIEDAGDTSKQEGEQAHPLQHHWALYHDSKSRGPPGVFQQPGNNGEQSPYVHPPNTASGDYEAGLTAIGEFNTVEDFCRYFNWLKPPSQLERNSNYHLFKDGIKPMWEDPANSNGGKWVLTMRSNPELLDRCWNWLAMALVGEELDERDEICGAVVSLRAKIDRIQLWLRTKDDIERINSIGKRFVKLLDVGAESGISLEFQYNTEDRPTHTKFISIVAPTTGSYFRSRPGPPNSTISEAAPGDMPPASAPGIGGFNAAGTTSSGFGGMGSFSTGAPAAAWRARGSGGAAAATPVSRTVSAFTSHARSSSASGATGSGQAS